MYVLSIVLGFWHGLLLCVTTQGGYKIFFGRGTKLTVESGKWNTNTFLTLYMRELCIQGWGIGCVLMHCVTSGSSNKLTFSKGTKLFIHTSKWMHKLFEWFYSSRTWIEQYYVCQEKDFWVERCLNLVIPYSSVYMLLAYKKSDTNEKSIHKKRTLITWW